MPKIAFSNAQRQHLRQHYFSQNPRPRQKELIEWFKGEYGRKLSQSTISESLSDTYKHLDAAPQTKHPQFRNRQGKWPILEQILFSWQQQVQSSGAFVSGELLMEKAAEIWLKVPEYAGQKPPEFSPGWVGRFKSRYGLKEYTSHGEISSVPGSAHAEMDLLRTICRRFLAPYMYDMDEQSWQQSIKESDN